MTGNLNRLLAGVGLLLGMVPAIAQAQQATVISGRVTSQAQAPLQGVSVSIPSLNLGAYTTPEGRYSFTVPASYNGRTVSLSLGGSGSRSARRRSRSPEPR